MLSIVDVFFDTISESAESVFGIFISKDGFEWRVGAMGCCSPFSRYCFSMVFNGSLPGSYVPHSACQSIMANALAGFVGLEATLTANLRSNLLLVTHRGISPWSCCIAFAAVVFKARQHTRRHLHCTPSNRSSWPSTQHAGACCVEGFIV